MERRSSIDITAEILYIARKGAKKTHIVYKANLNHSLLKQYLERLEAQGLITRENNGGEKIKTTERGLKFIEQYRNLQFIANF